MIPTLPKTSARPLVAALLAVASLTPVYSASPRDIAISDGALGYYELGTPKAAGTVTAFGATTPAGTSAGVTAGASNLLSDTDGAAKYDGMQSLTSIPASATLNPSGSFAVEAWIAPTGERSDNASPVILASDGLTTGWKLTHGPTFADGYTFSLYNGTSTPVATVTGGTYSVFGNHVVAVYDASAHTITLYVDDTPSLPVSASSFTPNTTKPVTLGGGATGTTFFSGVIDEFAIYTGANILNATKVDAHYTSGTSFPATTAYSAVVTGDHPALYLRLDEKDPNRVAAVNVATANPAGETKPLGTAADGVQFPGAVMQVPGAILGSDNNFAVNYRAIDNSSNDGDNATVLPNLPEMNTKSFSAEAWVRPTSTGPSNACVVFRNHDDVDPGNRSGWVVWQRSPSQGWNLRLYNAAGTTKSIDLTALPYTVGQWVHLAVTYDDSTKTAKLYANGQVATQTSSQAVGYTPLISTVIPSFGGFANGQENPFIGDMDEVAYYDKVLTQTQITAHYNSGVNASRTTPYDTLVNGDGPIAYYRQGEAAKNQVTNQGSLAAKAVGTTVNAPPQVAGPNAPDFKGFPAATKASLFGGTTYVELNNPTELNFSGEITLEAWVQPGATQPASATIIGHGGDLAFTEMFLRIENNQYQIGTSDNRTATAFSVVAAADIPAGDLGTTSWIHLAGTWSNTTKQWTIYRNGEPVATKEDTTHGATPVDNANWAIGARGRWHVKGFPSAPLGDQRVFNGSIATAGIYSKALTDAQIKAHYDAGVTLSTALSPLTIVQQGNQVTLTWEGSGVLSQSTDLINWTDVTGATSGYQTTVSGKQFFRLHN